MLFWLVTAWLLHMLFFLWFLQTEEASVSWWWSLQSFSTSQYRFLQCCHLSGEVSSTDLTHCACATGVSEYLGPKCTGILHESKLPWASSSRCCPTQTHLFNHRSRPQAFSNYAAGTPVCCSLLWICGWCSAFPLRGLQLSKLTGSPRHLMCPD